MKVSLWSNVFKPSASLWLENVELLPYEHLSEVWICMLQHEICCNFRCIFLFPPHSYRYYINAMALRNLYLIGLSL